LPLIAAADAFQASHPAFLYYSVSEYIIDETSLGSAVALWRYSSS